MGFWGSLFGNGNSSGSPLTIEQKMTLSIDDLFDFAARDCMPLISLVESGSRKLSDKQKNELITEYISLYIGLFYLFLISPANKDIFNTQSADKLYNYFTNAILDKVYTKDGNAVESNNFVEYATKNYKNTDIKVMLKCVPFFQDKLYRILTDEPNDVIINFAVINCTTNPNPITNVLDFYKIRVSAFHDV